MTSLAYPVAKQTMMPAAATIAAFATVLHRRTLQEHVTIECAIAQGERVLLTIELGDDPTFATLTKRLATCMLSLGAEESPAETNHGPIAGSIRLEANNATHVTALSPCLALTSSEPGSPCRVLREPGSAD
ncbi:MAG TPA: hypothetical protein VFC19_40395, partial [Candidatus Limnocylindrales bacterium]|nr:hypothetical protein [Candidatus Limnocylindrales bacterium]